MGERTDFFDLKLKTLTQERGDVYGHPLDDFKIIEMIKLAVYKCEHDEIRHALEMIAVKMARIVHASNNDHMDSVIDIAGYARTIAMILDEEERRKDGGA